MYKTLLIIILMSISSLNDPVQAEIRNTSTMYMIEDNLGKLFYCNLSAKTPILEEEGLLEVEADSYHFEGLSVAPNGDIYVINNSGKSILYKIFRDQLDGSATTNVKLTLVGDTGIEADTADEICSLKFNGNTLYGIGKRNNTVIKLGKIQSLFYF